MAEQPRRRRRRGISILGPVIFIAVGLVLLLNTFGVLEWTIWWQLLRLWPVLLIAVGLDLLIGRRSVWGSLFATLVVVALVVGFLWIIQSDTVTAEPVSQQIRQPLGSATEAEVAIEPAVGLLRIKATAESANLVEGVVHLRTGEEIDQEFRQEGDRAIYRLRTEGQSGVPYSTRRDERWVWELGLSPGAPLELKASLGAGDALLDLAGLQLQDLELDMGVGQARVYLPDQGPFEVQIDQAIGRLLIVVPEGLALRVHTDTAIVTRQMPDDFQRHGDDVYTSPEWEIADGGVELRVDQAIGVLTIRYAE